MDDLCQPDPGEEALSSPLGSGTSFDVNVHEAARILDERETSLAMSRWRRSGPAWEKRNGRIYYSRASLMQWKARHQPRHAARLERVAALLAMAEAGVDPATDAARLALEGDR
jgi:hypothetical protein